MYTELHIDTHIHTATHLQIYTHTLTSTHSHTYIHLHTYIHTPKPTHTLTLTGTDILSHTLLPHALIKLLIRVLVLDFLFPVLLTYPEKSPTSKPLFQSEVYDRPLAAFG
jgi:hypothetical protein